MKKIKLAHLPTPIQKINLPLLNTSKNIYIKRDDFTGTEMSGNKIRKLEYCLKEAQDLGADAIITSGAVQSNHCRATAAACAQLGMDCHLVLKGDRKQVEGNLFLDLFFGAEVYYTPHDKCQGEKVNEVAKQLNKNGHKVYIIPMGASSAVGSQGYVDCYKEILKQEKKMNISFDTIALAVGSGGTYAGLWHANNRKRDPKTLIGFSVLYPRSELIAIIEDIVGQMRPRPKKMKNIWLNDSYIGVGYGIATPEELNFYANVAQQTGIVLDPTYTGKAFRGLCNELDQIPGENILFIHTGGFFGWTQETRDNTISIL